VASTTNILGDIEIDFANGIFFALTGFSIAAMAIYGRNTGNLQLANAGTVGVAVLVVAIGLMGRNLLTSPATAFQGAAGYWGARIAALILGSGGTFSYYTTSSKSYFSSYVANVAEWLQVFLNVQIAAYVENAMFIGIAVLSYKILQSTGGVNNLPYIEIPEPLSSIIHLAISIIISGYGFARIHGLVTVDFLTRAIVLVAIMVGLLIAEDDGLIDIPVFPITFSAMYGLHSGININEAGGLFAYYSTIAAAQYPVDIMVKAVYFVDALMAIVAIWGLYQRLLR